MLTRESEYYRAEIERDSLLLERLRYDDYLEEYAREHYRMQRRDEHVYIIGGESLYRQTLPLADELCLTEIDAEAPQADAWFPPVDRSVWQEKSRDARPADEKHPCPYAFVDYVRR